MKYKDVLHKVYKGDLSKIPNRLLAIDPGETTGWALFEEGKLTRWGQEETVTKVGKEKVLNWAPLMRLFTMSPDVVVCENYRIYAHKLERHSFSQVETLRLIGGIDLLCSMCNGKGPTPIYYQMSVQHKGFVKDERLKEWGFWKEGQKHSRDAIRAGIYFLIITNKGE